MSYLGYPVGYDASDAWMNPVTRTEKNVLAGQKMYNIYCQHCHGMTGNNDGGVIKSGQYPPPPWSGYSDQIVKDLSDGKMFHTITHGKGNMGSHASVLTPEQRWQVIHYVRKLSLGDEFVYEEDKVYSNDASSSQSMDQGTVSASPKWLTGYSFATINPQEYSVLWQSMKNVKFDFNSFKRPKKSSEPYMDKIVSFMTNNPELKAVVVGHNGIDVGLSNAQESQSEKRAEAVVNYFIEKGIAENRLSFKGMGTKVPVASNDNSEGRKANRRVEIYFVK
jgi:outer membrane protein OmpA-like peptidoglycan-associated protein